LAVVVGFGAWWTYFDFAGHRSPRPGRAATVQWMLGHLPLTAAVAASLGAWDADRGLYRPLAVACAVAAAACLGVGAARPAPLVFSAALVLLFGVPSGLAVVRRVTHEEPSR
jgi:hypothetical protein